MTMTPIKILVVYHLVEAALMVSICEVLKKAYDEVCSRQVCVPWLIWERKL